MALWGNSDSTAVTGTVTITQNANTLTGNVVGSGTAFTTEAEVGNYFIFGANNYLIVSIANDEFAVVQSGIHGGTVTAVGGGSTVTLSEKPAYVAAAEAANNAGHGDASKVFGVSTAEMTAGRSNTTVASYVVVSGGSGYSANAAVTVNDPTGAANTSLANSTVTVGKVTAITANISLGGYKTSPTVTVAAPGSINIVANSTGFSNTNDTLLITTANSKFVVGDRLYYGVPAGNTAIGGLTGNSYYYVVFANTTQIAISATSGGANVNITGDGSVNPAETHTVKSDTATGYAVLAGGQSAAHSGWVRRTVGTGGRAGRVQEEVLVATGTIANDAEDIVFPDA